MTIKERLLDIRARQRIHKAAGIRLAGELEALQAECEHPNATSFKSGDYSGARFVVFSCPDCGLSDER
jgi:hypothetical protein